MPLNEKEKALIAEKTKNTRAKMHDLLNAQLGGARVSDAPATVPAVQRRPLPPAPKTDLPPPLPPRDYDPVEIARLIAAPTLPIPDAILLSQLPPPPPPVFTPYATVALPPAVLPPPPAVLPPPPAVLPPPPAVLPPLPAVLPPPPPPAVLPPPTVIAQQPKPAVSQIGQANIMDELKGKLLNRKNR